jgi:hypothetical protein
VKKQYSELASEGHCEKIQFQRARGWKIVMLILEDVYEQTHETCKVT